MPFFFFTGSLLSAVMVQNKKVSFDTVVFEIQVVNFEISQKKKDDSIKGKSHKPANELCSRSTCLSWHVIPPTAQQRPWFETVKKYLYLLIKIVHKIKWNDIISVSIPWPQKWLCKPMKTCSTLKLKLHWLDMIYLDIQNVLQQGNFPVDQLCPKKVAWSASIVLSDA